MERVTVIGGGPGAQTLLETLGGFPLDLRVVIPMVDSRGSSGKLREELGVLPTEDARKCLSALAKDDSKLIAQFLNYRFDERSSLEGHTVGNIMLAALKEILGSEADAIATIGRFTQCRGKIFPSTTDSIHLAAEYDDGSVLVGEDKIDNQQKPDRVIKKIWLEPEAKAYGAAVEALAGSDVIILGPANLHRSIIPTVLVRGILDAIRESGAILVYIVNLSGIPGQTYNYSALQHVNELQKYLDGVPLNVIIVNSSIPHKESLGWYRKSNKTYVENDLGRRHKEAKVVKGSFGIPVVCDVSGDITFRHNPEQLSYEILRIAKRL